ncbi:DUF4167 domain-containing protein [Pelagibacteraceae bacterium]|nr:DUF4167 domain-containing protein [Pelagibacteraceae bacterium]
MPNFVRRPRGRNNPRTNGRRPNANFRNGGSGQIVSLGETSNNNNFSRNRNGNRGGGNATKMFDKYKTLANDALSVGDIVLAESYFQHADHYARLLPPEPKPVIKSEESLNEPENESAETEDSVVSEDEVTAETDASKTVTEESVEK